MSNNETKQHKTYFSMKGMLIPSLIAVLSVFCQVAKAEGYSCNAAEITEAGDWDLNSINKKWYEIQKAGKSKEKEVGKLRIQFFEKLESKIREKCQVGDIISFSFSVKYDFSSNGEISELLCDYNKAIIIMYSKSRGSCVLAPHRGIRQLQ